MRLALLLALLAGAEPSDELEGAPAMVEAGGFVLYYNSEGPMTFIAMTPRDLPEGHVKIGEVYGRSCQYGFSVPLGLNPRSGSISAAGGDGGYRKALLDMKKRTPELRGFYDVKTDMHVRSVLTVFRRLCTEVWARGFR